LMKGLKEYPRMNKDRHSMGTRFRFCLLGAHVTKNFNDETPLIQELRTYTYSAALHWFSIHPSWPELDTPEEIIKDDVSILQEFVRRIKSEKNTSTRPQMSKGENQSDSVSQSSRKSKLSTVSSANKFMDLLEKLVHNEIERLKLWFNPQKPNQYIQFPPPLETISLKDISKTNWISYLKEAWNFSPRLALELSSHFRFLNVRKELEDLVIQNASSLMDIPEAVDYLITPENTKKNIKEFKLLLNWKPTTLAMALKYLNTPFAENPLIVQYAIRSLRQFSPEEVVFYLAQLVQNLRHDNDGYLRRYMLSVVKKSDMFAHQLMWSLRTEQISKEDMEDETEKLTPSDFEMRDIADDLIVDILNAFSVEQEKLYHEEFDFFDTVTKISGQLREIPKEQQDERKKGLIAAAEELKGKISKNLYLPSNVEHKIDSLYPQRSRVLKSAKKVPILLTFQTHKTDSEGKITSKNDVMCIFKMGDDCRQDQ
jgi:phosphatidylinositol 4-kinase A